MGIKRVMVVRKMVDGEIGEEIDRVAFNVTVARKRMEAVTKNTDLRNLYPDDFIYCFDPDDGHHRYPEVKV